MKSRHVELDGAFFCEAGGEATFERYVASPNRISNSFSAREVVALDHVVAQLLRGAFGPQPAVIRDGIQSLGIKSQQMMKKLEAQESPTS